MPVSSILVPGRIFATKNGWVRMIVAIDGDTVCYTDDGCDIDGKVLSTDYDVPYLSVCLRSTFRAKIDATSFVDDAARVERAREATRAYLLKKMRPMLDAEGVPEALHAAACRETCQRDHGRRSGYHYLFDAEGEA